MRNTSQRQLVLELVRSCKIHPTADQVFELARSRHPTIGRATVYRNLGQFRKDGTIQVIGNVDGEERYDGDTSPHSHFICRSCGKVADLPFSEVAMPDTSGVGRTDSCSVTFYGCCNDCL